MDTSNYLPGKYNIFVLNIIKNKFVSYTIEIINILVP